MGLMLKTQRDGKLRDCWYGVFTEADGTRKVVNLNVKWTGTPPASGRVGDTGDKVFEASREKAEEALAGFVENARHKGRAEHLVERLIESKAGTAPEYVVLSEMGDRWLAGSEYSNGYVGQCKAIFNRFLVFMQERNPKARFVYQIRPSDAQAFAESIRKTMSPATFKAYVGILRPACDLCLSAGSPNPFRSGKRGKQQASNGKADGSIHRRPFTPDELRRIIAAANGSDFMGGLITAAACTGMRRGDVCELRWQDCDLADGMVTTKANKTGEPVEVPIFTPLRSVLESRKRNGSEYVFPEAARMLAENPDGLTYRFKAIVARALDTAPAENLPEPTPAAEIETEGAAAIRAHVPEGERRARILDTFRRYCDGASVRDIEKATGRARASVSVDLGTVETWTGKRFLRRGPGRQTKGQTFGVKTAIARVTRADRQQGQRAASVRDWHALRTTFVTLALAAGVDIELVKRVTGHKTTAIVLQNYFQPNREHFRAALSNALPDVLTGGPGTKPVSDGEELTALAGKVAAGTATDADKKRLRLLAAKV